MVNNITTHKSKQIEPESYASTIAKETAVFTIVMDVMKAGDEFVEDPVRAELSRKTLEELNEKGYTTVVVYSDLCTDETKEVIKQTAHGYVEKIRGMGDAFLQAIGEVKKTELPYAVWMEVEKVPFIPFIPKVVAPLHDGEADYVVPTRMEAFEFPPLKSYPGFQAWEEMAGNEFFNKLFYGKKLDLTNDEDRKSYLDIWFGPDAFVVKEVSDFFIEYGKTDFSGKPNLSSCWDVHMLPTMSAKRRGKRIVSVPVDYRHPCSQTDAEENMKNYEVWCAKRIRQLTELTATISGYNKYLDEEAAGLS